MARAACTRLVASLAAALTLAAPASGAEPGPHFVDTVGDANFANDQGTRILTGVELQPTDTRPVSIGSADVVDVTFSTESQAVLENGIVRHVPVALQVRVRTSEPVAPTFGPTLALSVPANVNGCNMIFRAHLHGAASDPADPPQAAELRTREEECREGPKTYTDGVTLSLEGQIATLRYDLAAFKRGTTGIIAAGMTIAPDSDGTRLQVAPVRRINGSVVGGPVIDDAQMTTPFVIASDVPPAS